MSLKDFEKTCLHVRPKSLTKHYQTQNNMLQGIESMWNNMCEAAMSVQDLRTASIDGCVLPLLNFK